MKIIRNKYIPFQGYKAINLFGVLFVKNNAKISDKDLMHESIHSEQIKELLYIPFYIWYFIEWIIKLFIYRDFKKAYRNISFEKEAYLNQYNYDYLKNRKRYAWIRKQATS